MKVLALGGCGGMGSHAVRTMIINRWCDHIVIADKNVDLARRFSSQLGDATSWHEVDITDPGSLFRAMKDVDMVMNTTGPYHRFGETVLKAAIDSGCDYVDVCDDWEPTIQMFDLNDAAREAGVTAIIGMGATPGISNMLAVKAMDDLDQATELYTCWDITHALPEQGAAKPSAATVHGIHQLTGSIRVFEEGQFRDSRPMKRRKIEYPQLGRYTFHTIGHPEAVTFPRYRKSLKVSLNLFSAPLHVLWATRLLTALVNLGILTVRRAAIVAETLEPRGNSNPSRQDYEAMAILLEKKKILPPLFALARGIKDDRPATVACAVMSAPPGGMGGATGVPLALGAKLLSEGKQDKFGVFSPEGIAEPDDFFNKLAPLCDPIKTGVDDMLYITRSWDSER